MFTYKAFGLEIASEIELPGMTPGSGNELRECDPDVVITLGAADPSQITGAEVEGPNYLVTGSDVYLWWDEIGKVKISKGEQVTVEPIASLEGSDELNLIPFLLGPVMSLMLHQRGFLVLHGSAVNMGKVATSEISSGAVAFLGHRGNGKSTTAIHLYVEGYPLVAIKFDEAGKPVVYPGYPHVRLSEEAYNQVKEHTDILTPLKTLAGKVFCDASYQFSPEPVKLERIYVIWKVHDGAGGKVIPEADNAEAIVNTGISVLNSQENLIDLIRHSVANRIFQQTTQKENLINCAQLVNNVTVKQLVLVHSFEDIQDMVHFIHRFHTIST
ncbi:MAG: hypothetical protein KUA33_08870 [Methanobacterium sp.]|nr:hypothetical protein [Euryarchaeota archaeon]MBU4607718.1 hypothetical protein [Euryarchaeota archaeon]MBV1730318.1 hypothetical protein [Methanobacterium sp.]MBV1756152.1 hypothetical protein [Methanobacterium sp.]MBV1768153.1 hypothetical protein [Methanobacterium sp.]